MTNLKLASVGLALIMSATFVSAANGKTHQEKTISVVVDRHAVTGDFYSVPGMVVASPRSDRAKQRRRERERTTQSAEKVAGIQEIASSGSAPLVDQARRYLGTNPTGRSSLWCGAFMAVIAPQAAARVSNPNMARSYLELPKTSLHVGAIAVLSRGRSARSGHVGVVSGIDGDGNPIIISGNHGRRVGEGVYSKHRVLAYVVGQ